MKTIAFPGVDIPDIPRAVALGIFDGVHIGHRAVITPFSLSFYIGIFYRSIF